jgi:small-conductance mechanosensitive channel
MKTMGMFIILALSGQTAPTAGASRPATAPASKPTDAPEVRKANRTVEDWREAASRAAQQLTEFERQRTEEIKQLQEQQAKLKAQREQLSPEAAKSLPGEVLELQTRASLAAQQLLEDRCQLLRLRLELAEQQVQVAEGQADLKTRRAGLTQTLQAVGPDDPERFRIAAANAADKLEDLKKQIELVKSEALSGEKLLGSASTRLEEWRRRRDQNRAALAKDLPGAKTPAEAELLRGRLAALEQIVGLEEKRLSVTRDRLASRRGMVSALQKAVELAGADLDFRRQVLQQVRDRVIQLRAREAAQAVEAEQRAQARRTRQIQALRRQLEQQKRDAVQDVAGLAQSKEAEEAAGPTRKALWQARYEAATERLDAADGYFELIGAIRQLDELVLGSLEDRAEAEKRLAAGDASIRQLDRDLALLLDKQRAAEDAAEALQDLPAKARRRALDALREMRHPKLTAGELAELWDKAFGSTTKPATTTRPSPASQVRTTLHPPVLEEPAFPKLLDEEIKRRAQGLSRQELPPELRGEDIQKLRGDYEQLAARPWELRKRQYELAVAQAAILYRAHQVARENTASLAEYIAKNRERRARLLWARHEAVVELQTVQGAWSDVTYLFRLAKGSLEAFPDWIRGLEVSRVLPCVGLLAASLLIAWRVGFVVRRRLGGLRRRIRSDWPGTGTTRIAFAAVRVAGRVHRALWLYLLAGAACWLLGAGRRDRLYLFVFLALLFAYQVLRAVAKAVLSPNHRQYRLVSIRGTQARHLYRVLANHLLFGLVIAVLVVAAGYAQRPPDVRLLLWKLYLVSAFIFLLWLMSHQSLLFRFLPKPFTPMSRAARWVLLVTIYPAMLFLSLAWWASLVFRFSNLSSYLLDVLIKTGVGFAISYGMFLLVTGRIASFLRERQEARSDEAEAATPQTVGESAIGRYRVWAQGAIAIATLALIFAYWDQRLGGLGKSEAAPDSVRWVVAKAGQGYEAGKTFYLGKFDPKLGRYSGLPWRITVGFLVILLAWAIARGTRRVVNRFVFAYTGLQQGIRETILSLLTYVVVGGGILIGLGKAGLNPSSLTVVSGAFIFGITFGLQDIFRNFISGILLHFARPIRIGDFVEIGGRRGTVMNIGARSTRILGEDNVAVDVPNGLIAGGNVINWSYPSSLSMLRVPVQVTRDAPVATVRQIMLDVAGRHPLVIQNPPPEASFQTLAAGMMAFELLVWSQAVTQSRRIISELLFQIEAELKKVTVK